MRSRDYPIVLAEAIRDLKKQFKKFAFQNADLVREGITNDEILVRLFDIQDDRFYFQITEPNLVNGVPHFLIRYLPEEEDSFTSNQKGYNYIDKEIVNDFTGWLTLLEKYNSINLSDEDYLTHEY